MLMVLRQWNTNIICWPWNPTSWNFILERDRFGSLPISLSNHMKTNAIKKLHYEWNLKIVSKLRELLGENKVNKFSNITSSQILNCARVHRIDRVLHNWEKKQTNAPLSICTVVQFFKFPFPRPITGNSFCHVVLVLESKRKILVKLSHFLRWNIIEL